MLVHFSFIPGDGKGTEGVTEDGKYEEKLKRCKKVVI
jgi:hypothetical protein